MPPYLLPTLFTQINVKNVPKGEIGATFNCPECRKETFSPLPNVPVDKWAEHYPYNTVLLSVLPPEKRKVDKNCDSCLYEGSSVRATSYCTVCKEALCPTCENVHKKNKALRDHAVVNMQDLFTDPKLAVILSVSVFCPEHVGKEFEFYCKSHSGMCYSECFYKSHRGCIEVLKLKDNSKRLLKEKDTNRFVDRLTQLSAHLDQFKNENEGSYKKIEAEVEIMPDEIEVLREKINTLLDNVKAKITMEKTTFLKEESIVRHVENQQCESISSSITNSLHLLQTVLTHGNHLHVLTTLHKTEEQLHHYQSAVNEKYCEVRHVDAKLSFSDLLPSLIESSVTNMATIDIVEKTQCLTLSFLPLAIEKTLKTTEVRHNASQAKKKTVEEHIETQKWLSSKPLKDCYPYRTVQFNANYPNGKNLTYTGIICLPYGKIMLVDTYNATCRLYDSSHQHLDDYTLTSRPWDVYVVGNYRVAVTLFNEKKIQLLNVASSIQPERTIYTSLRCTGIAALSKGQLVLSGNLNNILYWGIEYMDGFHTPLFSVCTTKYCSQLAVNNSRRNIYVSCDQPAAVYAYSADGRLIFRYKHWALGGASGVAVDREDNLYVVEDTETWCRHLN